MHHDVVYVACSVFVVFSSIKNRGRRTRDRMVVGLTYVQLPVQSML